MTGPTLRTFLRKGYFPNEVPAPFNTESFASEITARAGALPEEFDGKQPTSKPVRHDLTRPGQLPRRFSIPNPSAAVAVAKLVADSWDELDLILRRSRLTTSRPTPTSHPRAPTDHRRTTRALEFSHSWPDRQLRAADVRSVGRYIVRADISLFYPSIYTHTIPWAIHGKDIAKARRRDMTLLGNQLDTAIRKGQDQQTIGIPIGPDWSHVLAELVLARVDESLQSADPVPRGYRMLDDYEFACSSEDQAERVLSALRAELAEYELRLNSTKTGIFQAPVDHFPAWRAQLRAVEIGQGRSQHDDLLDYFDLAASLGRQFRTATPLKFAVGGTRHLTLRSENWPLFQYLLFQAILSEPDVIRSGFLALYIHRTRGLTIDRQGLADCLTQLILRRAPQRGSSDVAWSLWSAILFEVNLPLEVSLEVGKMADSVVAILALDARERGLLPKLNTSLWETLITAEQLRDEHWLLAYEAPMKGWLGTRSHLASKPEFQALERWGVSFYDADRWLRQARSGVVSTQWDEYPF